MFSEDCLETYSWADRNKWPICVHSWTVAFSRLIAQTWSAFKCGWVDCQALNHANYKTWSLFILPSDYCLTLAWSDSGDEYAHHQTAAVPFKKLFNYWILNCFTNHSSFIFLMLFGPTLFRRDGLLTKINLKDTPKHIFVFLGKDPTLGLHGDSSKFAQCLLSLFIAYQLYNQSINRLRH